MSSSSLIPRPETGNEASHHLAWLPGPKQPKLGGSSLVPRPVCRFQLHERTQATKNWVGPENEARVEANVVLVI